MSAPQFALRRVRGDRHRCLLAGVAGNTQSMIDVEPGAPGDKSGQRFRQFDDERLSGRSRQVVAQQERLPDGGKIAEPLDDAVD